MPDASPSWRSTFIQALVLILVFALAWLKAVSNEVTAGALMMVVTAIFMGQNHRSSLAAVQAATNASNPRMPAMRLPMGGPGPNERVTVEMNETREPATATHGRVQRQPTPGEIRSVDPRVEQSGSTDYTGRGSRGGGGGRGGGFDTRRMALGVFEPSEWLAMVMLAVFLVTAALMFTAKLAVAGILR